MTQLKALKWHYARDSILRAIQDGKFTSGQKLPPEQKLASDLAINHRTLRRSLDELSKEGLIDKKPGVGNFVKEVKPQEQVKQIAILLPSWMRDTGAESTVESLKKIEGESSADIIHHPGPMVVLNETSRLLDPANYNVIILFYRKNSFWQDAGQVIQARGIKGIIFGPITGVAYADFLKLKSTGAHIVLMAIPPEEWGPLDVCRVKIASWSFPLVQILNKFYELGHRRICVVQYKIPGQISGGESIYEAFRKQTGLNAPDDLRILDVRNDTPPPDFRVLEKIFEFNPRPTAVVVPDEFSASIVFRECYRRHLRIPEDVSLAAAQDNAPGIHSVPLAATDSLRVQARAVQIAVQYLLRLFAGEEILDKEIVLQADVQWKASVGTAKI